MNARAGLPLLVLLAGCIPQAAPPPRYASPPSSDRFAHATDDGGQSPPRQRAVPEEAPARVDVPPSRVDGIRPAPPLARPAWEARPVAAEASPVPATTATVRRGETLALVAARTRTAAGAIAQANELSPDARLRVGQVLTIPGGRYHQVRAGEAGIAIARAYGVPWSRIVAANALAEPYLLRAGERILIPAPPSTAGNPTSLAAERARAFTLDVDDILTGGEPALAVHQQPVRSVAMSSRALPPTAQLAAPARLQGGFAWPVEGDLIARFGPGRSGERNDGVGIAVPLRTPIHAAADGVVIYAGTGVTALGGIVIIKHGEGWTTVYGHASKLLVTRGQAVKRGQTIALSGRTGDADQPDVHFELRRGRVPVDPATQLGALGGT